jgi:hypothetical protein
VAKEDTGAYAQKGARGESGAAQCVTPPPHPPHPHPTAFPRPPTRCRSSTRARGEARRRTSTRARRRTSTRRSTQDGGEGRGGGGCVVGSCPPRRGLRNQRGRGIKTITRWRGGKIAPTGPSGPTVGLGRSADAACRPSSAAVGAAGGMGGGAGITLRTAVVVCVSTSACRRPHAASTDPPPAARPGRTSFSRCALAIAAALHAHRYSHITARPVRWVSRGRVPADVWRRWGPRGDKKGLGRIGMSWIEPSEQRACDGFFLFAIARSLQTRVHQQTDNF